MAHEYPKSLAVTGPNYPMVLSKAAEEPEVYYPNVHLENCDLPDSGTITFRYRVVREVNEVKADKVCTDLDLLEIVSVKADKKSQADEYGGDALDKLKAALDAATEN